MTAGFPAGICAVGAVGVGNGVTALVAAEITGATGMAVLAVGGTFKFALNTSLMMASLGAAPTLFASICSAEL